MQRRSFICHTAAMMLAVGATALGRPASRAQGDTPSADLAGLGLPDAVIVVDDRGFTVPTGSMPGRTLLTVENHGTQPLHFFTVRIPDTVSNAQLEEDMASAEGMPEWFDLTKLPSLGNPDWPAPGGHAQGVIDLAAGRWLLIDPNGGRAGALWEVSEGEASAAGREPASDVAVELHEMAFTGLEHAIPAGPRIWRITNRGALEHELAVLPVAEGTTESDALQHITNLVQGDDPSQFAPVAGQGIATAGVTSWQQFDLAAGTYAAVCMTPMPGEGYRPHAMEGMVTVFIVQ